MHAFDVFAHGAVDGLTVAHVRDVDDDLDEMLHRPASFFDQLADVLHHLVGLLDWIMAVDIHGIIQVLRTLPAQPDRLAALRDNGLTQIIVEVLFRVCIARVEFTNAVCAIGVPFDFWLFGSRGDDRSLAIIVGIGALNGDLISDEFGIMPNAP